MHPPYDAGVQSNVAHVKNYGNLLKNLARFRICPALPAPSVPVRACAPYRANKA